jgi:hypothetical protein
MSCVLYLRLRVSLLLVFLLAACSASPALSGRAVGTPTLKLIARQQAIDIAVKSASMSRPEVSPALTKPGNIQAEQISLGEAMRRAGNGEIRCAACASTPVWFITMDGLWEDEMPAPGVTAIPGYYHHATEIIDAVTGKEINGSLRP